MRNTITARELKARARRDIWKAACRAAQAQYYELAGCKEKPEVIAEARRTVQAIVDASEDDCCEA